MSDSDASLPLPSPADSGGDMDDKVKVCRSLGRDTDDSNSDSGSSPGKIPTPSTPKDGRDSISHSSTLLEDIPYPTDVDTSQVPNQDHDDIPLPPDSSRYSPSQVTPGDDENEAMMSPSESTESSSLDKKPSTVTMKVLGSAQAKKRLLAFSASKQAAVSYSPLSKKISPLKGVSVFHQAASKKEITKEQTLAIASIKEEETKMKEILAMNSILNEKLKQVKSITENIPKAPPVTAVVNPTIITSENFRISDINAKLNDEEMFSKKGSASANSRNLRKKRASSSSRSRSRSQSMSKSPSVDSRSRKRDKHSRSRSRDRGRERERDRRDRERDRSDRERIREKEKKGSSRKSRSRSRSPKIKKEKKKSKSRSRSPKHKTRDKDKSRKRSKSRSHSADRGRKRSPKSENKKDHETRDRDRERGRVKDKEREVEREKEKERERKENERKREEEKKREREEAVERELDKIRKVRMPHDWSDYEMHQYRPTDIHKLWGAMVIKSSRSKSPTQSDTKGSNPIKDIPQPTPLSKTLSKQLKTMNVIPVESKSGGSVDYPVAFVKSTKTKPSITYGCNTLTYSGYYKSRQQVFKDEEADIMHAMSEIISQKGSTVKQFPSSTDEWKSKKKQQEWFAQNDQNFCPSEGSKGIVISHLYSDDEGEDSPAGSLKNRKQASANDRNIDSTPIPVLQQKSPSSPDSMDSAPSPLLKKKYNSDEPSGKDNVIHEKDISRLDENRRKRDNSSYDKSSSDEERNRDEPVRQGDIKKLGKVSANVGTDKEKSRKSDRQADIESKSKKNYNEDDKLSHSRRSDNKDISPKIQDEEDDDMYEEMELEEFPLEKEIVANSKTSEKEKKDKEKHKSKESKDKGKKVKKQKKKKKHHKSSKEKLEKKKSSDEEEEDIDEHDSSDADSARLKTAKKLAKKDKCEKISKEKRHRKRRSKTESSKDSDSSSGSEHTDDSSKKRPKKKRNKLSPTREETELEKSGETKKSKLPTLEAQPSLLPVEKEKSRKDKKKKHDSKSKSKKKHSRKNRDSSSSSSSESSESDSSSSSDSSDSSDEGSDTDRKVKKEKKKKSKKDRKESKKEKGRDKTPDTSDDENQNRRGGGRRDRGGGGGTGGSSGRPSSGGNYHKDYRERDRDHSYRDRDRDRGDKRSHYGRRRPNGEFGELFDSLGDWDIDAKVFSPRQDENEKLACMPELVKEQPGKLSDTATQAHELLTAMDNDLLLQSVLKNEDLSAEALLKQIIEPVESDKSTVGNKPLFNLSTTIAPSNWSDDSEAEISVTVEKTDQSNVQSSGFGTERSTDILSDGKSEKKSDGSVSSSEDSTDSDSSSSSSDSQSDSDSSNPTEKTDLSEVKNSARSTNVSENVPRASNQVPVLYDPFADNSDATSSDAEKKEELKVKQEKLNNIMTDVVHNEGTKFYEDLKNTMEVLTKYKSKVEDNINVTCSESVKQNESAPMKLIEPITSAESSVKILENSSEKVEISPTKLLNFKISGNKLDKSNLTAFGTEDSADSQVTKSVMQKKEKAIPVITSNDHVEQFPISVLGSTCNKIIPIPDVNVFTEEHINLGGIDNYRCDSRENHERNRYIKHVPTLRSRSRSFSRSPSRSKSRSRSRSFSPHRRGVPAAPPNSRFHRSGSCERERGLGRSHRHRSPPPEMFYHGRRSYGSDRRRHYHQGHPGDIMSRRRERERFRRPTSRSKSRSRSRSMSRSRSRSISPRSHHSGYHRSRQMEMFDRDRRGRGYYFDSRDQRERRFARDRDYHDRERSRTPDHLSPTELRMRKKHCEFIDERLPHDDRIPLKGRDNKLLGTESERDLVPVAEKQESPPLQLNVADSTISDSELASRNTGTQLSAGSMYIGGISREMLIDHHNSGHMELPHPLEAQLHVGHHPPESLENDMCSDYNSPPRRLSLDERLEMEMGISLRDEPVNKIQQALGGYYYPPSVYRMPGQEHPDQGKYLPVPPHAQMGGMEHHPGVIPGSWNAAGKGFFNGKPQRVQSQIVQVGNVIQVVPAEIPIEPITITSSTKSRRSGSSERKKQSVPKRVVTIKVPVVPFSVPFLNPEELTQMQPPQLSEEESIARLRRKSKKLKRKRRMAAELAKKRVTTIGEEEDVTPGDKEEIQETSSKESTQQKNEENLSEGNSENPDVDNPETKKDENSVVSNPQNVSESTAATEKISDGVVVEEVKEKERPPLRKIEILPAPDKGILVAAGFREKTLDENNEKIIKGVKFADGINPGCGTSSSEGEEMASPPPPSERNAVLASKKSKVLKKKKIKVKIVRKVEEKKEEEPKAESELENQPPPASPPPCPSAPYPFCPPGILYQVCSQYAVLYAQAMAEKGIDIVFQPSTQIPEMGENLILSDTLGDASLEASENIDFQTSESALVTIHPPSYEHTSPNIPCVPSPTESPVQTTGSRIPTIIRTSNSPPMLDFIDKSDCNLMVAPLSNEIMSNSIPSSLSRTRNINKNIVEIPIVDMDSLPNNLLQPETISVSQPELNLDEIPLPMAISPSKIPVPSGTPPLSFHISRKPKKYSKSKHSNTNHIMPLKLKAKSRSVSSTPTFIHSASSSNIVVTPIADPLYDYNPYSHTDSQCHSQSRRHSPGSAVVPIPASAPPLHIPTIPPGVDLSRPPPSFTPPPPGTIDYSSPSPSSSAASALGISRYNTDHTF